jgi:hypothetical protein
MVEIERMIAEAQEWRLWHRARRSFIEAAACDIRETALIQARDAILKEGK